MKRYNLGYAKHFPRGEKKRICDTFHIVTEFCFLENAVACLIIDEQWILFVDKYKPIYNQHKATVAQLPQ